MLGDLSRAAVLLLLPLAWLFDMANQFNPPEIVQSDQITEGSPKPSASQQTAGVVGQQQGPVSLERSARRWLSP